MNNKKFKLGDRVVLRHDPHSPIIEVVKYVDDQIIEGVYFDKGKRLVGLFPTHRLTKAQRSTGLFKI